jgi:hypothetical protein
MTFSSGTTITQWRDKSGNANNATATGSPAVAQNSINGLQAVTAAVGTYFLGSVSITGPSLTCFGVATTDVTMPNVRSPRADQRLVSLASGSNLDYNVTGGVVALHNKDATNTISTYNNFPLASNPISTGVPFMAVTQYNGTTGSLWYNGSPGSVASSGSVTNFTITKYGIGNQANPTNEYWSGFIGEIILYNNALTTSQRQQVEGYLAWKWGLQANLPASHQYKAITPSPLFSTQAFVSTTMAQRLPSLVRYVSFTPSSFSGLQLWLDAADPSVVIKSGTTVTAWNDKSGNGYNMNTLPDNYYTGNPPIYPSVGTAINKLSTIYFSAFAGLKQATVINGAKNFYWVGRIASDTGGDGVYFLMGSDSTSGFYDWHGSGGVNTLILTTVYAQAGILAASPASQYTSGANAVVNTTFSNIIYPSAGDISLLSVAGLSGNTLYQGVCFDRIYHPGWCGDLAEVVIYSTALTTFQHQKVEGYLAWKWGLQGTLPAKHPYKLFPPAP